MFTFRRSIVFALVMCITCLSALASDSLGEDLPKRNSIMTVDEMCGGCVKKITKRFEGIKGIAKVECDIPKRQVTISPKDGFRLSPRGVWDIMAEIGKTPQKMICPDGTFVKRPPK